MAKVAIKSEELSPLGGFFSIMEQFASSLEAIDALRPRFDTEPRLGPGRQHWRRCFILLTRARIYPKVCLFPNHTITRL